MRNTSKRDLVIEISNDTGMIMTVVQKFMDGIADSLEHGKPVELRNFGVFEVKIIKARVGRNPNKPKVTVQIPAQPKVKFTMGKVMRERVLQIPMGKDNALGKRP